MNMYFEKIETLYRYDSSLILDEMNIIFKKYNLIESFDLHNQICINDAIENSSDVLSGVGSLNSDWSKFKFVSGELRVPRQQHVKKEIDFKYICNQFKYTVFEDIYKELCSKYKIGRVRIMRSKPKTCLSWHNDKTSRIHYPLKTQEGCFMLFEDQVFHLEKETWYITYTKNYHTAFNSSTENRVHLVASVLD